jgi:hypothetical protein
MPNRIADATDTDSARTDFQTVAGEFVASNAVRLTRSHRGYSIAAKDILAIRDGLQVLRIDTARHAAAVIEREAIRYRTDESLIGNSMSENAPIGERDSSVAIAIDGGKP